MFKGGTSNEMNNSSQGNPVFQSSIDITELKGRHNNCSMLNLEDLSDFACDIKDLNIYTHDRQLSRISSQQGTLACDEYSGNMRLPSENTDLCRNIQKQYPSIADGHPTGHFTNWFGSAIGVQLACEHRNENSPVRNDGKSVNTISSSEVAGTITSTALDTPKVVGNGTDTSPKHGDSNSGSSSSSNNNNNNRRNTNHPGNGNEPYHHEEHHINQKISNHHKILTSLIAGGMAGAIAKTTIAPLDRTKINFQTSEMKFSFRKAIEFIMKTYRTEGFFTLWRGNSATMVRIVPYAAIQFAAHEQYKLMLNKNRNRKHLPPPLRALAGSMAGITATTCTYPLDFARARMAVTSKSKYGNLFIVFRTVLKDEGWRVLFRGYTPTVLGSCVYSGISFFMYETLKIMHAEYSKGVDPTAFERWCCGAVAGLCGQCTSYPLDIVRRRMQTAGVTDHSKDYTSIVRTALFVYRREGLIGGLYKGLSMNWIKGPVSAGISFMVFDTVQRWLRRLSVFHIDD